MDRAQIGTSILPVKYHLVAEWGRTTDDVRCELTPTAIDVDPLGEIFVVEPGERNRIVIYDSAKLRANPCEIIGTIGVAGTLNHIDSFYITAFGGPSSLSFPQGVAVNKDGTYAYVADSWHNLIKKYKILREGPDNKITKSDLDPVKNVYSRMLPWQVTLNHPQGVAVVTYDQKDYVFVADTANNRVVAYVTEGDGPFNFVTYYGADASGKSNGQFVSPQGIAVDGDGELYVSDTLGNRVLKIKVVDGSIAKTFGLCDPDNPQCPASLSAPWGIVVDSSFNVFVADKAHDRVVKFDRDGKVKAIIGGEENSDEFHLNEPLGVAVDASGRVYIADSKNFRIVVVGPSL